MSQRNSAGILICKCGSKDFETASCGRNHLGRQEYRLICRRCHATVQVGKTTFALYHYVSNCRPSEPFLKLFDLG